MGCLQVSLGSFFQDEDEPAHGLLGYLPEDVFSLFVQPAGGYAEDLIPFSRAPDHLRCVVLVLGVVQVGWCVSNEEYQPDGAGDASSCRLPTRGGLVETLRVVIATVGLHFIDAPGEPLHVAVEFVEPGHVLISPVPVAHHSELQVGIGGRLDICLAVECSVLFIWWISSAMLPVESSRKSTSRGMFPPKCIVPSRVIS